MRRWFTHAFVAFITFAISVFGTLLFLIVTGNQPQPVNAPSCPEESAPKLQERTDDSSVRSPYETMAFTSPNPGTAQSVRADKHPSFASIVTTMRTLVQLKKKIVLDTILCTSRTCRQKMDMNSPTHIGKKISQLQVFNCRLPCQFF